MSTPQTNYRQELQRICRAMAEARTDAVINDLELGSVPEFMKMFVEDNVDKRYDKLQKQLEILKDAFTGEELNEIFLAFMDKVPLGAYDSGQYDGEKLLKWLEANRPLTPVQRDVVRCQRARHAVENLGRVKRREHIRFQEFASLSAELASELGENPSLKIHLNPLRVWTQFETNTLLDDEAPTPADVLFFAVRNNISTAMLEEHGRNLIDELATLEPATLTTWAILTEHADREELIELCRDLAEMGLVAFS